MADVSVRFQVAGDSEIVLNLGTAEAVRLVEAIMRKVAEAVGGPSMGNNGMGNPAMGGPSIGGGSLGNNGMGGTQRAAVGSSWPEMPQSGNGLPPTR
ncbi:hypothetical protein MXD61_10985 [Frankia sp. AgPm24]|uniref:hypothetical protein n=1 Tax=Frankia sp. AgPm24 TaxID=631128 RepID=UPI00200E0C96|nr:hypothetical protein [Frankia sp. AgPm24]MCK9922395.1 hypothetical protein [Frankia sp. AgPm24]